MKATDLPIDYNMCEILEHNLEQRSEKIALLSEYGSLTFRQVSDEVNQVGNALKRLGVRFGECVFSPMHGWPYLRSHRGF